MPPEWIEALKIGGPLSVVLGGIAWLFINNTIQATSVVQKQLDARDKELAAARAECEQVRKDKEAEVARLQAAAAAEIARLHARNDQLWRDLRDTVNEARKLANAVTRTAEVTTTIVKGQQ